MGAAFMVKIVEQKVKEKTLEVRIREDLLALTKSMVGKARVETRNAIADPDFNVPFYWAIDMAGKEGGILVIPQIKQVTVYDTGHYHEALGLAEAYEKQTREKWTLEKKYR